MIDIDAPAIAALAASLLIVGACGQGVVESTPGPDAAAHSVVVTVHPESAQIEPGVSVNFAASVFGTSQPDVVWSVTENDGGTIDDAGKYTAPSTAGKYHVAATSAADPASQAVVTVTVDPDPVNTPGAPVVCWGACQPDNTQTGTVASASSADCDGGDPVLSRSCVYTPPPPGTTLTYPEVPASTKLLNPERGFYDWHGLVGLDASKIRSKGWTLTYAMGDLSGYTATSQLPASLLAAFGQGLQNARNSGVKVVLRFTYSPGGGTPTDAPLSIVQSHIKQLSPLLNSYADVIAVLEEGFIGAFGEGDPGTTSNKELVTQAGRAAVARTLLDSSPKNMLTAFRMPEYKARTMAYFNGNITTAAFPAPTLLTAATARNGSYSARIGFHNDCFMATTPCDAGTFNCGTDSSSLAIAEAERNYMANDGGYTVVGGEVCDHYSTRTSCATAESELRRFHYSFLSGVWGPLDLLKTQGCYDRIDSLMGYRFYLQSATIPSSARPGGSANFSFVILNRGYAAMYNKRPVYLVLSGGGNTYKMLVPESSADPRKWAPDQQGGPITVSATLTIPAAVVPGTYQLSLWLPDAATSLQSDPRYAVQLASAGTWNSSTGHNVLTNEFAVQP
jgi:hypothetical protein